MFEVLGDINAPGVDTAVIIRKYNLSDVHSDEAIAEALSSDRRSNRRTLPAVPTSVTGRP